MSKSESPSFFREQATLTTQLDRIHNTDMITTRQNTQYRYDYNKIGRKAAGLNFA